MKQILARKLYKYSESFHYLSNISQLPPSSLQCLVRLSTDIDISETLNHL